MPHAQLGTQLGLVRELHLVQLLRCRYCYQVPNKQAGEYRLVGPGNGQYRYNQTFLLLL